MKKYGRYLALAATLVLMGVIFYFSAQPGTVSDKVSEAVMNSLQSSKANRFTPQWFSTTSLHANIRKWAHVYIYCALGVSMTVTVHLWTRKISLWQQGLLAAALCTLSGMGDELHQFFVPGRAMLLSDVGIDAMGYMPCIAAACLLIWAAGKLQRKKRR